MSKTAIEWTDDTWNPVRGCSRVSEGCRHCYAEQQAARIVRMGKGNPTAYDGLVKLSKIPASSDDARKSDGPEWIKNLGGDGRAFAFGVEARWTGVVRMVPEHIADPLRWRAPRRIFVNSMSDLFHEKLTNEEIAAVFGVMAAAPQHTFQVLTKRAQRMREWFAWLRGPSEDTFTMQQRGLVAAPNTARALLDAAYEYLGKAHKPELDAAWKSWRVEADPWPLPNVWLGVSVENQDAAEERIPDLLTAPAAVRFLSCEPLLGPVDLERWLLPAMRSFDDAPLDWVIAGCESGPGARHCSVDWLRSLRDQCAGAGVAFLLKQAREEIERNGEDVYQVAAGPGSKCKPGGIIGAPYLDGRQHLDFPVRP